MPELPEVETVRRGLLPVLEGQVIAHADVRRPDLRRPLPERLADRLSGKHVIALRRRSKYLLLDLSSGETLIWHLGMSGRVLISGPEGSSVETASYVHAHAAPEKHDHVILETDTGHRVTFNDPRRFGSMDMALTEAVEEHPLIAGIGPEPLGNAFHEDYLLAHFKGRKAPVKSVLLDQRFVAGLGNIYVCEALFRAGISPRRSAGRISAARASALVPIIRTVLTEAIAAGGSSLRDHRQTNGELGYFQHAFKVYGREGKPCVTPDCNAEIARLVQSGRSSFYCPHCQR